MVREAVSAPYLEVFLAGLDGGLEQTSLVESVPCPMPGGLELNGL